MKARITNAIERGALERVHHGSRSIGRVVESRLCSTGIFECAVWRIRIRRSLIISNSGILITERCTSLNPTSQTMIFSGLSEI